MSSADAKKLLQNIKISSAFGWFVIKGSLENTFRLQYLHSQSQDNSVLNASLYLVVRVAAAHLEIPRARSSALFHS